MSIPFLNASYQSAGRQGTPVDLIVVHWMDGTLAGTDQVFTNNTRQASAHYGVEDDTVHQYVLEENTAWGAGDWPTNLRSINIEHSAQPGRDATDATYTTSAALIADICTRHGIIPGPDTIRPHHDFTSTTCPGTLDLPRLISLAARTTPPTLGDAFMPALTETEQRRILAAADMILDTPGRTPGPRSLTTDDGAYLLTQLLTKADGGYLVSLIQTLRTNPGTPDQFISALGKALTAGKQP